MIISASRRTDIPAYYSDWFINRLSQGFVITQNPYNANQVKTVPLTADSVDGFVFWSKNPAPLIPHIDRLRPYPYYFQFTITSYGHDVEPHLPHKRSILSTFQRLVDQIGPERVLLRYDPVLITPRYTAEYHIGAFDKLVNALSGYTHKCTFSFIDSYAKSDLRMAALGAEHITTDVMRELARAFAQSASNQGIALCTCAEQIELSEFGIEHGRCVDGQLLASISGRPIKTARDRNQRGSCGCHASVDIGAYDTCPGGCAYCYATRSPKLSARNMALHDVTSPSLGKR